MGYAFETAIADILDNSISANATRIHIISPPQEHYVAIVDNGHGMSRDELISAMRFGARSPLETRAHDDLGRFGLGMKTASLSQCRRLTVATRKDGETTAACWDLDTLERTKDWTLGLPSPDFYQEIPEFNRLPQTGTLLVWENFDRFGDRKEKTVSEALRQRISTSRDHIATTFHRFLAKDRESSVPKVEITINSAPVVSIDPFEQARTVNEDPLWLDGHKVSVRITELSHESHTPNLSDEEKKTLRESLRQEQGFYLYRNYRLIARATWFRTRGRRDDSRFVRIMIDIPNAMDDAWNIDVRKSSAEPPTALCGDLQRIARTYIKASEKKHNSRARTLPTARGASDFTSIWLREQHREGFRYRLNSKHTLVQSLLESSSDENDERLRLFLQLLESSLPVTQIHDDYARISNVFQEIQSGSLTEAELKGILYYHVDNALDQGVPRQELFSEIMKEPPWAQQSQSSMKRALDEVLRELDL